MATNTPNINLEKPDGLDKFQRATFNSNMDKVDAHAGTKASESTIGHVELATDAETTAGTDNTRAVHPAGLKVELDKKISHSLATATDDFLVASGAGTFVKKTSDEVKSILSLGSAAYTDSTSYVDAETFSTHVSDYNTHVGELDAQVTAFNEHAEAFNTHTADKDAHGLGGGVINTQSISLGANTIKHTGKTPTFPKIHFKGLKIVNLIGVLGSMSVDSGNGIAKGWATGAYLREATPSIVSGRQKIVTTSADTSTDRYIQMSGILTVNKYYFISAEIEADAVGYADIAYFANVGTGSSEKIQNKKKRVGIKVNPTDTSTLNILRCRVMNAIGTIGTVYFDNYMAIEITTDEYDNLTIDQLLAKYPYVESAAFLQNPYFENCRYNLVPNGNGEEGMTGWMIVSTPPKATFENGYFVVTDDNASAYEGIYQAIKCKPSTPYIARAIAHASDSSNGCQLRVVEFDASNNPTYHIVNTTSLIDTELATSFTTLSSAVSIRIYLVGGTGTDKVGTGYFKEVMLVEGTSTPIEYISCDPKEFVIEGQFADEDEVTLESGKLSGQLSWGHNTIYGKDWDLQFFTDYTGFKSISIPSFTKVTNALPESNSDNGLIYIVKYDGKILGVGTSLGADRGGTSLAAQDLLIISTSDTDTGWTDAINPNNDEVKAFMNGWKAVNYSASRYVAWISVIDGSAPKGTPQTTIAAASATGATTLTLVDASVFSVGTNILIQYGASGTGYAWRTISAINGNVITLNSSLTSTASIGFFVYKCDNGTGDVSLLTWCKNNIAPGYEGYRLHYKLATPELITDANTHIQGELWDIVSGDNYIDIECGIVLGETATYKNIGGYMQLNEQTDPSTWLRYRVESYLNSYKNLQNDTAKVYATWLTTTGFLRYVYTLADFDINATYTVDYQILKTLHAQVFGLLELSYPQDVFTAIETIAGAVEEKQQHDNALDKLVDLSLYEHIEIDYSFPVTWFVYGTKMYVCIQVPVQPKRVTPLIAINSISMVQGGTVSPPHIEKLLTFNSVNARNNVLTLYYSIADTATIDAIKTYGAYVTGLDVELICAGKI